MSMNKALARAIGGFLCLVIMAIGTARAMDALTASDVEIRATVPGMTATGGYLTIQNHTGATERLVAVTAAFAARAELHTMIHENGVMKMRKLPDGIEIPAGGTVELEPGGLHLMLMGLSRTLEPGQTLEVELTFASGKTMRLPAHVKRPADIVASGDSGGHGDAHSHSHGHSHNHSHNRSHNQAGN